MTIDYKNIPVHVEVSGEGEPLLLVHGFLENCKIWRELTAVLKKRYKVICPDLFGHGQTPSYKTISKMAEMADAILAVLEALKIDSANFIGHSMGGYVSLAFVENYPDRVSRLMLLDSSPWADSRERRRERDQVIHVVQQHKNIFLKSAVNRLFSEEGRNKFQSKIEDLIEDGKKMETGSIIAAAKGMKDRRDRTRILTDFSKPKWIISGKDDALIPFEKIKATAAAAHCEFHGVPGGHMSYIEQADKVENLIVQFLQEKTSVI